MRRTVRGLALLGISCFFSFASADFGFTSASFNYVQLSSPLTLAWNGQSGQVELRLMKFPADANLSYLPIAANLTGSSYTWIPSSIASGSQWTLEGIDADGSIAASQNPFTITGLEGPGSSISTSLMQQKPQSTAQSTTLATSASPTTTQATSTTTAPMASPDGSQPPASDSTSKDRQIALSLAVVLGVAVAASLATYFLLRYRRRKQNKNRRSWLHANGPPNASQLYEADDNASMETLAKPMELQGSRVEGTSSTSKGDRIELGPMTASRLMGGKRISMAPGAVETSMGKRFELG